MSSEEVKILAKEVIEEINKEKKDKRLHNTRLLMKYYNPLKEHLESVSEDISKFNFDIDEEEDARTFIGSIARSKIRTAKMISYLESAIDIIEKRYKANGEVEKYQAFVMHYIYENTNEEIQEKFNCGKNTPRRWSNTIIDELSVLLWGVDALGI